jgi:cytochrome c2
MRILPVFALLLGSAMPALAQDAADAELIAQGETVYGQCAGCHAIGEGATHRFGPHLNGIYGRIAGTADGYRYSPAMIAAGEQGLTWAPETLMEFIESPQTHVPGTKMSFGGIADEAARAALAAYVGTFSPDYVPEAAAPAN